MTDTDNINPAYQTILDSVLPANLQEAEAALGAAARRWPLPSGELGENVQLFQTPRSLKRLLYLNELYLKILPVHGVIMQFGVRWGRDIAAFEGFRTVYEPFNISRRIIGFDTFEGFPSVDPRDGDHGMMVQQGLATAPDYAAQLESLLALRQATDPLPQLKRTELVKGDVSETVGAFLAANPGVVIAMVHFDLDLYAPTKAGLEAIAPYLTKGAVVAFDELNSALAPGETEALREAWGLDRYAIRRSPQHSGQGSYLVIE